MKVDFFKLDFPPEMSDLIEESNQNLCVGNDSYIREMSPTQNFSSGNGGSITSVSLPEALRPPGGFHKDYTRRNEVPTMARTRGHTRNFNPYSEPKAWRKLMKHRKRRAEVRRALTGRKDWDNTVWPLDKKPWIYYW